MLRTWYVVFGLERYPIEVLAATKSEARAVAKRHFGYGRKERLPIGCLVLAKD